MYTLDKAVDSFSLMFEDVYNFDTVIGDVTFDVLVVIKPKTIPMLLDKQLLHEEYMGFPVVFLQ